MRFPRPQYRALFAPTSPRRIPAAAVAVATIMAASAVPAVAGSQAAVAPSQATVHFPAGTHLLEQLYQTGLARLGNGDPGGAVRVLQVSYDIAPELSQMHYSLALAKVIADFSHRERALPLIHEAMAGGPSQPLYAILEVLADQNFSTLKGDNALYISAAGQGRLSAALAALPGAKDAYNGKYLAMLFAMTEPTGDAQWPLRLANFNAMLGAGNHVMLPRINEPLSLGRLLALEVSVDTLAPYEPRMEQRFAAAMTAQPTAIADSPVVSADLLAQAPEPAPEH